MLETNNLNNAEIFRQIYVELSTDVNIKTEFLEIENEPRDW